MKYLNINKDNKLVLSEDKTYQRAELINKFSSELDKSKIRHSSIVRNRGSLYSFTVFIREREITVNCFIKNITGAGWESKPNFKRIQVSNVNSLLGKNKQVNIAFGYYEFDNNPIIVSWDLYRYLKHNTVRSCYVTTDSLVLGYNLGFFEGVVSSQKLWIFKGEYFEKFLLNFLDYLNSLYKEEH